jgi:hypothetical protein
MRTTLDYDRCGAWSLSSQVTIARKGVMDFVCLARVLHKEELRGHTRVECAAFSRMLSDVSSLSSGFRPLLAQIDFNVDHKNSAYASWYLEALRNRAVVTTSFHAWLGLALLYVEANDSTVILKGGLITFFPRPPKKFLSTVCFPLII